MTNPIVAITNEANSISPVNQPGMALGRREVGQKNGHGWHGPRIEAWAPFPACRYFRQTGALQCVCAHKYTHCSIICAEEEQKFCANVDKVLRHFNQPAHKNAHKKTEIILDYDRSEGGVDYLDKVWVQSCMDILLLLNLCACMPEIYLCCYYLVFLAVT